MINRGLKTFLLPGYFTIIDHRKHFGNAILRAQGESLWRGSSRFSILLFCAFASFSAQAATSPDPEAMMDLRQQFAERIGRKMHEADLLMSGENKLHLMEIQSGSVIADGEQLMMRGTVGEQALQLGQEIIVVKKNDRLLVSLADVVAALEFPVTVSPADGTAAGWFVREDQPFKLDTKKSEVTIAGETSRIAPEDISASAEDILVSTALVEKWAGLIIGLDLQGLALAFKGERPLPIEEKERRKKLPKYAASSTDVAQLPLKEEPYHIFSKPYLDVNIGAGASRLDGNSPMRSTSAWSAIGAGDMLGFSSRIFASGNWDSDGTGEPLNALRLTFGREDPDGHVLGLPGVRSVEFGDVDAVNLPLLGGGVQEQGVYLSNRLAGDITTQSRMDIRGDTLPGWDVELYNNESLLGIQTAGNDGRYTFPAVFLFEGENVMRLVFYGPQGETREEIRRIVSHASSIAAGESKWETSLTRTNESTYNAQDSNSPIDGDPHLTARYEYSFGPQGSVNMGVTHRSELGGTASATKDYVQAGLATNLAGALVTADAAYDVDGEYVADVLARRSFGQHQTGLQLQHSSGAFPQGGLASFAPENLVQANIRGPFADHFLGLSNISYTGDAGYSTGSGGVKTMQAGASLNGRAGNLTASTSLNYTNSETLGVGTSPEDRLSGATSLRGNVGRGRWRLSTDYGVQPFDLHNVAANYTYPFTPQLQGVAEVRHQTDDGLSTLELSARWRHDKFVLSPRVEVDTDEQLTMGVNMNFSLADDPYGEGYSMYNRGLTSTGGVAARVYLDKNGDGIFNTGDELLPDVDVRSLQSGGRGTTGEKGVAFIPSLQRGVRTDIVVEPETLPDPYYQPSTAGNSVRPRPGVT